MSESFYIYRTNEMVLEASVGDKKSNQIVVVCTDDVSDTIEDAKDYSFSVRYAMDGEKIRETDEDSESTENTDEEIVAE